MKIKFKTLILQCKKEKTVIDFSEQLSFFHGEIGVGKSSIARLIDYCLGNDLEMTSALKSEMVSASLLANLNDYEVLFERERGSNQIQVTWQNNENEQATVLAPIANSPDPIWESEIYSLSDLIFYLCEVNPIKVRRSKVDPNSPMIRLSFRDLMWYCYLDQTHIDSSFFNLEDTYKGPKSCDVMKYIVGYYTEKLSELERMLAKTKSEQQTKLESANQLRGFLKQFEFETEEQIAKEIEKYENEKISNLKNLKSKKGEYKNATHFVDDLRRRLTELSESISVETNTLKDLESEITQKKTLKSELLASKFKLARLVTASSLLMGAKFDMCPACGSSQLPPKNNDSECYLCGDPLESAKNESEIPIRNEMIRSDLTSRIDEISIAIERQSLSFKKQGKELERLIEMKVELDEQLNRELENYDSKYVSDVLLLERENATLDERLKNLQKMKKVPEYIHRMETEADQLSAKISEIQRKLEQEKDTLVDADENISLIEKEFLDALLQTKIPGVGKEDRARINRKTWKASISPNGRDLEKWTFEEAGSGGKKTLFKVCYALAVHVSAAENNLPLPSFLIIDTPMKNIGEGVNRDLFESFYKYVYKLIKGPLSKTQIIVIDKEYFEPEVKSFKLVERYMKLNDPKHPPLIPYYVGP